MAPRARELGIPFDGRPGRWNAITDVPGVEVGQVTVVPERSNVAVPGHWVRTGVTAIHPRGRDDSRPVFAGISTLNGNGELTGAAWVAESGWLGGPILTTSTHTVGLARDCIIRWLRERRGPEEGWLLPVVGETWDGYLHDVAGGHLREEHVWRALDTARSGPVEEGGVGGGTASICYGFKGGIGTASRTIEGGTVPFHVGVLVQANHGRASQLRIAGVPVGRSLSAESPEPREAGSILVFVATDVPLLPHQLQRLARRAGLGLARSGSISGNGSGDFFLAFSTTSAPGPRHQDGPVAMVSMWANDELDPLFEATVTATDEAIVNCLVAGTTTVGFHEHRVEGLPVGRVLELLRAAPS